MGMTKYQEKEKYLSRFPEILSSDFYRFMFPVGSFEPELGYQKEYPNTKKGNAFIVYENDENKVHTRLVFDDLGEIEKALQFKTVFMSPISYFGRNRTAANARELFALTFDLDNMGEEEIRLLFSGWIDPKRVPCPTYIVNSGGGVHLYYVFETPIPMYPNIQKQIKKMKYELTSIIWNGDTSREETRQYQGINQGFRLVGSKTKHGEMVKAYKTGDRVTLEYLSQFVSPKNSITDTFYHSKMTLEQAKKKYPDWYEQRIVMGRQKKNWTCHRNLYDWWKSKRPNVQVHHRYFYIMCLAVYAIKAGVSYEELKKDAMTFQPVLSDLDKSNPFTKDDVKSALEMYQECYRSFPRDEISKLTAIEIIANRRNGRPQYQHLVRARAMRDINQSEQGSIWNGRKSYKEAVFLFLQMNPKATVKDFCELTQMKKSVFYKYKKEYDSQPADQKCL